MKRLQRDADASGKVFRCLILSKLKLGLELKKIVRSAEARFRVKKNSGMAEVRFRVKTENHFEATNNEQFQPNPSFFLF